MMNVRTSPDTVAACLDAVTRSASNGTVRVFRQKFTLDDAIGSHACSLQAIRCVTNGIPLGCPLLTGSHCKFRPNTEGSTEVRLTKSALDGGEYLSQKHADSAGAAGATGAARTAVDGRGTLTEAGNETVLFRLMERLYCVIQEVSFPFPQGFHHRFVTLAYRALPRSLFKQYLANRVLRVTEEFSMRTLGELDGYGARRFQCAQFATMVDQTMR
jgi:hypothetical protein